MARKLTKKQSKTLEQALVDERAELLDQVADLQADAGVDRWRGDASGDDPADRGTATSERETAATLSDHARRLMGEIDEALRRIEAGTYGVCTRCGENIGFDRLEAVPAAALCLDCKRRDESGR
ncbi:MAG: TraR/DksA C4-type zinc finger protein [Nitriliruptor sp.]|uniref:TraR/DksA family transcriptional regulator n=1 Tax=Nitriliruptor sp. TaxID=2448056 RepID=UPI0034A0965D